MLIKRFIFSILLALITFNALSQWELMHISDDYIFEGVFFFDTEHGFVSGWDIANIDDNIFDCCGVILQTFDGGQTWDTTLLPTVPREFFFFNEDTGFAASNQALLYKTTNGGDTWETIVINPNQPTMLNFNYYTSLFFQNDTVGFMSGHAGNSSPSSLLIRTFDGGITWNQVGVSYPPFTFGVSGKSQVCFPDSTTGYVGMEYKTIDGGLNWYYLADSTLTPFLNSGNEFLCNDFFNSTHGLVGGQYNTGDIHDPEHGFIGVTNDGGITWDYQDFGHCYRIYDIEIWDSTLTYASTYYMTHQIVNNPPGILCSIDGGFNWSVQALEQDSLLPYINKISSASKDTAYAVGFSVLLQSGELSYYRGLIYKTINSGGAYLNVDKPDIADNSGNKLVNPVREQIKLLSGPEPNFYSLYSITGSLINLGSWRGEINVNFLPNGVYILHLESKEGTSIHKIIKQ